MQIKPIQEEQKNNSNSSAIIQITMTWDIGSPDDIDLWLVDPAKNKIGYANREYNGVFLDRDDMGSKSNFIIDADGNKIMLTERKEIISIRQTMYGEYIIQAHAYSKTSFEPTKVRIQIYHIKNKKEISSGEFEFQYTKQEYTFLRFTVAKDGSIVNLNQLPYKLVK